MNRICLNPNELGRCDFSVCDITMNRALVTPPATFKCVKGQFEKSRFFYVVKGTFMANGGTENELAVHAGEILYLPSDVVYRSEWLAEERGEYISFVCRLLTSSGEEMVLGPDMFVICKDMGGKYLQAMTEMLGYYTKNSPSALLRLKSRFFSFLGSILDEHERMRIQEDALAYSIHDGVVYLNENYLSGVSVQQAASLCGMSESTFRRSFIRCFGMPPREYIDVLRLEKAKELLRSGMYNVNEVADFLNFYDTAHFNKFFKKKCGIPPGKFD